MAFIPSSNSVVAFQSDPTKLVGTFSVVGNMNSSVTAFQGTSPWIVNQPSPSIIAYQAAGSIMAISGNFSAGNTSVTAFQGGAWSTSITGGYSNIIGSVLVTGSVATYQGTTPWIVNQPSPSIVAYQAAGSIMAVSGSFTANPQNSIIALQLAGSVMAVSGISITATSVTGTMSVLGTVPVTQATTPWIIGSVLLGSSNASIITVGGSTGNSSVQLLSGQNNIGSVTAIQGTNPWVVNMPSPSVIAYQAAGSVMAVSGSFSGGNSSVQLLGSNAVIGSVTALQGTQPWLTQVVSSVNAIISDGAQTLDLYEENQADASVIGIAMMWKSNLTTSILSAITTATPLPVQGSVAVLQGTNPWQVNLSSPSILIITPAGSVQAVRTDNASVIAVLSNSSVAVLQGTNPWLIANSSVLSLQGTLPWVIQSIVGTYPDNSAWTEGNSGHYMLGVRNDTMSSVSAADLRYTAWAVGPVGETITANAPITKWVQGVTSVFGGVSVQALAPQGTSIFTYITGVQVINPSANNVYVTFTGGLGGITSVLGYTVAPANGGSNIVLPNAWKTGANSGFSASVSGVASVYLAVEGFISKT